MIRGPNQWPRRPPEIKDACQRYQRVMRQMSDLLAAALEGPNALNLPAGTFASMFQDIPYTRMKLVNYPARERTVREFSSAQWGCGPHKVCRYSLIMHLLIA